MIKKISISFGLPAGFLTLAICTEYEVIFFIQFYGFRQQQMAPSFARGCVYQITHLPLAFYANVLYGYVAVSLPSHICHLFDGV